MRFLFLVYIFLLSCNSHFQDDVVYVRDLPPKKQKQRIAVLRKKLDLAVREKLEADDNVEFLRTQLYYTEIAWVQGVIDGFDVEVQKSDQTYSQVAKNLRIDLERPFLEEREVLYRIVKSGPSPASLEAQKVLDHLLTIVTRLND